MTHIIYLSLKLCFVWWVHIETRRIWAFLLRLVFNYLYICQFIFQIYKDWWLFKFIVLTIVGFSLFFLLFSIQNVTTVQHSFSRIWALILLFSTLKFCIKINLPFSVALQQVFVSILCDCIVPYTFLLVKVRSNIRIGAENWGSTDHSFWLTVWWSFDMVNWIDVLSRLGLEQDWLGDTFHWLSWFACFIAFFFWSIIIIHESFSNGIIIVLGVSIQNIFNLFELFQSFLYFLFALYNSSAEIIDLVRSKRSIVLLGRSRINFWLRFL